MEEKNVFTAKTVDEALEMGLEALGLTLDEIDYEVLEEGRKKLFGSVKAVVKIVPKNAKKAVESAVKEEKPAKKSEKPATKPAAKPAAKPAKPVHEKGAKSEGNTVDPVAFVDGLLKFLGVEGKSEINEDGSVIEIKTESSARVIGKHGDVLDAIQCLAGAAMNIGKDEYKKVIVDCEEYRAQREQTLKDLAAKIAAKAVDTGRKIILEPMTPYERRVIHAALSENGEVKTASEGREPARFVVVIPNNARPGDRGIRYGERRRDGDRRYNSRGRDRRDGDRRDRRRDGGQRPSGGAKRGKKEIHFGTFLGNSNDNKEN